MATGEEDLGGEGGAFYGTLAVVNSFAPLNGGGGFRCLNCFAIRAGEFWFFRCEGQVANIGRDIANFGKRGLNCL